MTIKTSFDASAKFANPAGNVHGGMLAAMLDETMGGALAATLERGQSAPTADMQVQFLLPVQPGRLLGFGRVTRKGQALAFLSGELVAEHGQTVATATAASVIRQSRTARAGQDVASDK